MHSDGTLAADGGFRDISFWPGKLCPIDAQKLIPLIAQENFLCWPAAVYTAQLADGFWT